MDCDAAATRPSVSRPNAAELSEQVEKSVAELANAARETRENVAAFADSLSAHARSFRDEVDAIRRNSSDVSPSLALAQARAAASPGSVWRAYRVVQAPWSFAVRKAAATFGAEALLVSVTIAHCIAAGAALVATPVVFMVQSDFVRKAETLRERDYQRERRAVSLVCGATLPVSFVVATSNSWRCYAADDDHGAVAWALGAPLLHCTLVYGLSSLLAYRHENEPGESSIGDVTTKITE
jgi:hypothetical protein